MLYENERALTPYLLSSESLLWSGRPATGFIFRKSDMFFVPFSLAWGGFAFFWEYSVFRAGAPVFFLFFGGIFVLVGLHLIFGRFIYDILQRRRTIYALTGERVLRLTGKTLGAWKLRDLPQAYLSLRKDHSGTISFGALSIPGVPVGGRYWNMQQTISLPVLERIPNASDVFNMIQAAQSKLR